MIEKKFNIIFTEDGTSHLTIEFEDKKYELLSTLFFADSSTICKIAIQKIRDIYENIISDWEATGNVCSIKITKENTIVCDIFDESVSCNISTLDFKSLLDDWFYELSKYNK